MERMDGDDNGIEVGRVGHSYVGIEVGVGEGDELLLLPVLMTSVRYV